MADRADWRAGIERLAERHRLPADAAGRLVALLELVRDDDGAPTTVRDPSVGLHVHLTDSLSALDLPEVRGARTIADLGTGAGFPALPLACALPDAEVFAVESRASKCAFLERAVECCGLRNAHVECARAEEWPCRDLAVVCARAVAPLPVLLEYAAPLLRPGGAFVAYRGQRDADEESAARGAAALLGLREERVVAVAPFPGADHHHLHLYVKVGQTPPRFPRRSGMARKRPLGR